MELLVSLAIGVISATAVYLLLQQRTFPVILGLTMLTYAANLFLFSMGRLAVNQPAVIRSDEVVYTDPVPQALVLTAIVISFGMTALIVVLAMRSFLETGSDRVDLAIIDFSTDGEVNTALDNESNDANVGENDELPPAEAT